ncbi:6447_t:CDS:2 [Funneliformis caledonium]|uniref:6447_t:CDS:1 n=1 Tax=Funneliformis caledonium TaxID=1117310 RepID=A0A9N9GAG7_9GLOM|nr:6447_t:CDS:2 [Funneliformis caledonium]
MVTGQMPGVRMHGGGFTRWLKLPPLHTSMGQLPADARRSSHGYKEHRFKEN